MPRQASTDDRFDWSAEAAATKHGYSPRQIENAFDDPRRIVFPSSFGNRHGQQYSMDHRKVMLAQDKPHGPYLHIAYVLEHGKIRVFHARSMNSTELRHYRGRQ